MTKWLAAFLLLLGLTGPAAAQVDGAPKVHARLIAAKDAVAPGGTLTVAFEQVIRPGWHTYWKNPGDVGQPTTLEWSLPAGWKAGALQWPYPIRLPVGPFMDYGYEGKVWILSTLTAPADAKPGDAITLTAKATWLVCKEVCIPEEATLILPVVIGTPAHDIDAAGFAAARARMPAPSPWPAHYQVSGDTLDIGLSGLTTLPAAASFFPNEATDIVNTAPQTLGRNADGIVLRTKSDKGLARRTTLGGVLVLTSGDGSVQALDIAATHGVVAAPQMEEPAEQGSLLLALAFAFLGGLILNLMPCVLPVLAMKAFALSSQAGRDRAEAVRESFAYGIGAVISFVALGGLLLALRAGGDAIGWGFQLQEPIVVAGFALLMFGVGLNLSGVFEVAGFGGGESLTRRGGELGSFFTGVLAVAVAAPCTAPFMAAALGYALTQPAVSALAIFLVLGLGFAAPFVAIGISPWLMRALPKPGAWMIVFKQALAFAMYGTAAWLVWVLAQQAGADAVAAVLAAMVAAGFGAWVWGATRNASPRGRGIGAFVTLLAIVAALSCLAFLKTSAAAPVPLVNVTGIPEEPYSAARLASLRAENRPVFVNATAAWCITCLVNDKVALSTNAVRDAFAKKHIAYLVADWTRRDSAITALLSEHGRSGVPLYLYYAPGARDPAVLPQILTEGIVLDALEGK
ncbi:MAG: thioredoxin family protein [Proteobacteria bacterium]|nr:thioredoxin family protein [Pseudomonadota bacterium]